MALLVDPDHKLPTEDYEGLEELVNFRAACMQRYEQLGKPLAAFSQERIQQGYYVAESEMITCNLDKKESKTVVDLSFAEFVHVLNPFDSDAEVEITSNGRKSRLDSLKLEFTEAGVLLPSKEKAVWVLDGFKRKEEEAQEAARAAQPVPKRQRRGSMTCGAQPGQRGTGAAPATFESGLLNAALQRRLRKQTDEEVKAKQEKKDEA